MVVSSPDFIGTVLSLVLQKKLEDPDELTKIRGWEMKVIFETNFYPVSIIFDNGIEIKKGEVEDPTIRIFMTFDTMIDLVREKQSPIGAILSGKIRVKGLFRHPIATYRYYKLMMSSLRG
ncbi:MAG: SCP2 sterol-binding domain-containing protein [Candidatus Thorarchaeota archaeon]